MNCSVFSLLREGTCPSRTNTEACLMGWPNVKPKGWDNCSVARHNQASLMISVKCSCCMSSLYSHKARYTLATKSTISATKSTELATLSTATSCRIQVVVDLSPKPATNSNISAKVNFIDDLSPFRQQLTSLPVCIGLNGLCCH